MMSRALAEVSFRDTAGFVYTQRGDLRRRVNLVYRAHPDRLMGSGERSSISERGRPETVMPLALIHRLAFVGYQPMEDIAESFRGLAPWLVIGSLPEAGPRCVCWRGSEAACTANTTGRRASDASPDTSRS